MAQYAIKRGLGVIPVLVGLTLAIFLMMRVIPGDAASLMLEESQAAGAADAAELRKSLGLDEPLHMQYVLWVGNALRGDLGQSFWSRQPVSEILLRAAPVTIQLSIMAALLAAIVGLPVGVVSAIKQRTWWDYTGRSISILGLAIPNFWLATLAIVFPAIWFGWVPESQYRHIWVDPIGNLSQFWLPALITGVSASASLMRMTRSAMLEVMRQDYVRTARAKGLAEHRVVTVHVLRNALIPVVTLFGFLAAGLLTGSVITETVFNLPGFGSAVVRGIGQRDYPVIQGGVLMFGVIYSLVNLAVDLSYGYLNPRIRYE